MSRQTASWSGHVEIRLPAGDHTETLTVRATQAAAAALLAVQIAVAAARKALNVGREEPYDVAVSLSRDNDERP